MTYDLIIIGGGPAGVSAGVYAARKQLKTLMIVPEFGGQSIVSEKIENWIGTLEISGPDLAKQLEQHVSKYVNDAFVIRAGESVINIKKDTDEFIVVTDVAEYNTKTILIATGSTRRKLEVPGAKEFDNKGLTYCASCDGPLFAGSDVVVVGGGNAAFETSAQLLAYCKSVTLLNRTENYRADEITVNRLKQNSHFKIINNAVLKEIRGDKFVSSVVYEDDITHIEMEIQTPAVFVEIGLIPTTDFAKEIIKLNKIGQIPVDPRTQQTEIKGIWAAGDCTDGLYHQNNIASGDAVKALEDIYIELHTR